MNIHPFCHLYLKHDLAGVSLQGGNNIHAEGVSAIAQVLKDNSVITSVSLQISTPFFL